MLRHLAPATCPAKYGFGDLPRAHSQIAAVKVTARSRGLPTLAGNCDSLTYSREDTAITVGSHFGSRRTAFQRDWLPSGIGRSALTCEDAFAGTGCEGLSSALAMQEVKDHLQNRNMQLSCGNVELRGFEPLTSCMPYRPGPTPDRARSRPACRLAAKTLARCGLTSPGTCRHWLPSWLPVNSLAALTAQWPGQKADPVDSPRRVIADPADDHTGEDPPSDEMRDPRVLPGPIPPGRPQHCHARAVIIDDELDRAAADSRATPPG